MRRRVLSVLAASLAAASLVECPRALAVDETSQAPAADARPATTSPAEDAAADPAAQAPAATPPAAPPAAPAAARASSSTKTAREVSDAIRALGVGGDVRVSDAGRGVITLSGTVSTLQQRDDVARAAEHVCGVTMLYPNVVVRRLPSVSDAELAQRAQSALGGDGELSGVQVSVTGAQGTLTGSVQDGVARARAEDLVRKVEGLVRIENSIRLEPAPGSRELAADLRADLARRSLDATDVRVTQDGDRIVILGESYDVAAKHAIQDWAQRQGGRRVEDRVRYLVLGSADEDTQPGPIAAPRCAEADRN